MAPPYAVNGPTSSGCDSRRMPTVSVLKEGETLPCRMYYIRIKAVLRCDVLFTTYVQRMSETENGKCFFTKGLTSRSDPIAVTQSRVLSASCCVYATREEKANDTRRFDSVFMRFGIINRPSVERGQVQRRLLPAILDVGVGRAGVKQGPDGVGVAMLGGAVEGSLLVAVLKGINVLSCESTRRYVVA